MLEPFDARVVVKKPKREEQTESGIILPDTVNEQGQTAIGEVLAVGPGSRNMNDGQYMEMPLSVGDSIIYTKFSDCLLYTSPRQRDLSTSRMPSSA